MLASIALALSLLPLVLETIGYPGITKTRLGVEPYIFVLCAMVVTGVVRTFSFTALWKKIGTILFLVAAPVVSLVAILARIIEQLTYPNFMYATVHIDPVQLGLLGVYLTLISLPLLDRHFFEKYWRQSIVVLTIFLYHIHLLHWIDPRLFLEIGKEDGVIEYATFVAYAAAAFFSFRSLHYIRLLDIKNREKNILLVLVVLTTIALALIAGEEISWGQRVFEFQTPQQIAVRNTQKEFNFHNDAAIFGRVYTMYLLLNLYFIISWIFYPLIKGKITEFIDIFVRLYTSRWYLIGLFIPNLLYTLLRAYRGPIVIDKWEEITEVFLSLGLMAIWILNVRYLKKITTKKSTELHD